MENKFINGMSWDNYSIDGWHIVHIIPLKYNNQTLAQIIEMLHYSKVYHRALLEVLLLSPPALVILRKCILVLGASIAHRARNVPAPCKHNLPCIPLGLVVLLESLFMVKTAVFDFSNTPKSGVSLYLWYVCVWCYFNR